MNIHLEPAAESLVKIWSEREQRSVDAIISDLILARSGGDDFESLEARRKARYFAKLDASFEQAKNGRLIYKTMEELEAMAK